MQGDSNMKRQCGLTRRHLAEPYSPAHISSVRVQQRLYSSALGQAACFLFKLLQTCLSAITAGSEQTGEIRPLLARMQRVISASTDACLCGHELPRQSGRKQRAQVQLKLHVPQQFTNLRQFNPQHDSRPANSKCRSTGQLAVLLSPYHSIISACIQSCPCFPRLQGLCTGCCNAL